MGKIILHINGSQRSYSEEQLTAIVEKYSSTIKPKVGEWFEVKPQTIDQQLFCEARKDPRQESTRQLILEAFAEMKENPEQYGKTFQTLIPQIRWPSMRNAVQVREEASKLHGHNANWIEQSLEWAQRIHNGESWEAVCNKPDTAMYSRLITWKNGKSCIVGGELSSARNHSASYVFSHFYEDTEELFCEVVPLIVRYE